MSGWVRSFAKNDTEEVRVSLTEYKGGEYFDIRIFFKGGEGWRPSKKGITLPVDLIPQLKEAIAEAEEISARQE